MQTLKKSVVSVAAEADYPVPKRYGQRAQH